MTVSVDVIIEDDRWEAFDLTALAQAACQAGAKALGLGPFEVSILACNDARIAELNGSFRNKDQPTNVLSWPSEELGAKTAGGKPRVPFDSEIGDIAISYETCLREADESGKKMQDHVQHLILHGFLHLLGYDHERDADATLMEGLEIKALETLDIQNPYEISR